MKRFEIGADVKEVTVTWFKIEEQMLVDSLEVLLADKWGDVFVGVRDGDRYYDDYNHELYDIVYWAYIPRPVQRIYPDAIITDDKWVALAAKKGMLESSFFPTKSCKQEWEHKLT